MFIRRGRWNSSSVQRMRRRWLQPVFVYTAAAVTPLVVEPPPPRVNLPVWPLSPPSTHPNPLSFILVAFTHLIPLPSFLPLLPALSATPSPLQPLRLKNEPETTTHHPLLKKCVNSALIGCFWIRNYAPIGRFSDLLLLNVQLARAIVEMANQRANRWRHLFLQTTCYDTVRQKAK